jgi:molecular chaperone GrpE
MADKSKHKKRVNITRDHNDKRSTDELSDDSDSKLDEIDEPEMSDESTVEREEESEKMDVESQMEILEEKLSKATDDLLRERAAFINYRKRTEEEKDQIRRFGAQDLAFDLLTVLDYFEESLKFTSKDADSSPVIQGVKFTIEELHRLLGKHGVREIETDIPFDPKFHEAFGTEVTSEHKPDTILKVHRKGYLFKDRVLRPAMVTVSKAPGSETVQSGIKEVDEGISDKDRTSDADTESLNMETEQ